MNFTKPRLRISPKVNAADETSTPDLEKIANSLKSLTMAQIWYVITLAGKDPKELPSFNREHDTYQPMFDQVEEHLNRIDKKLKKIEKSIYSSKK